MKILSLTFLLLSSSVISAPLDSKQLDLFIIKACSIQSSEKSCLDKMSTIRKGLVSSDLLNLAPPLKIDSFIQTTIINDPKTFISNYYCLAIFNDVISMDQVPVDIFPYVIYGFSFNTKSLDSYSKWLKTKEALLCINSLKDQNLTPQIITSDKPSNIILNPATFLENGTEDAFLDIAVRNYNHERLHAIYAYEKAKTKVATLWKSLTSVEQQQFKSEHNNYNFKNTDILYREFFSFTFESNPEAAYDFLRSNSNYEKIKKSICKFCLANNESFKSKIKELASLDPKVLLKRLEDEKIKVLILSSGRKNSSQFFYWGQVRLDNGQLNQISAIEGAMGKTLCQGEKPESQSGITIVLASDSPYSTLLHEYIHVEQIKKDVSWCPVSKKIWNDPPSPSEIRMIRDREWDVRLVLWDLLALPQMNIEDQIIVSEGILRESEARLHFDPTAQKFLNKNKIKSFYEEKIKDFIKRSKQIVPYI